MKQGRTVQELAVEVARQQETKRDFLVTSNKVQPFAHGNVMELGFGINQNDSELFTGGLTSNGHVQLGAYLNIPKKYYDLMLPHTDLLIKNVQHWLSLSNDRRMIRVLDGNIRAWLSDSYRRLDNYDLCQMILPILAESGVVIESCEITESSIYIKAVSYKTEGEVKKGDIVYAGVIISNSEIGKGSLAIKPLIYRKVCDNGAIIDSLAMRKYHAGRLQEMEQIEFKKDTITADDRAFWLKTRDLVNHSLSMTTFEKVLESMRESTKIKVEEPEKAIELVTKRFGLIEDERKNVLKHLIEGGDLSSWGLGNAVTRTAQDVPSYDRSVELEGVGYLVMTQNWN